MKKILLLTLTVLTAFIWSCDKMYDKHEAYVGEIIYPAKFDTIIGSIGFERVELDLLKAGRIPSNQIKMGKAEKTVVEYDGEVLIIDSLVSWVNIEGLTQSKLYRFEVYTLDAYDNKSVTQEIALIPFTNQDLEAFAIAPPRVMASPSAAVIDWPNGISSVLMDYVSLSFTYTDKDGGEQGGERGQDSRFFIGNLTPGEPVGIDMEYQIVPIINRQPILDTVIFNDVLTVNMPTSSSTFAAAERDILIANGVETFTAEGVSGIEKLVYPVHAGSLQDIFYFPNLKVLDLTGGELFSLPETVYDRNDVVDVVGGGDYVPFMRKAGDISTGNRQALNDFLEAGLLEKIYYRPNTMGLDDLLMPYVAEGVVELVDGPNSVLMGENFNLNGIVQDWNWWADVTYPAIDPPAGDGLENIFSVRLRRPSASFVFALPREYQFNVEEYRYLKMKVHAPPKEVLSGDFAVYNNLWFRVMNRMWSFGHLSDYGQEYWDTPRDGGVIADEDLGTWKDVTIDMSEALGRHNRVIVINIGGEPWVTIEDDDEIVYHFSNIRFEKE